MNKKLYLIAGANGSGKTTLAHELLREEPGLIFINADEIAAQIGDNAGIAAGRVLLDQANTLLADGKSFAMESTISGSYHLRILRKAREKGYEINMIYVFLDTIGLNIARIKNRVLLGGHNVPDEDVVRRYRRSMKNFEAAVANSDAWKLYYNSDNGHILVATGCSDDIDISDDGLYEMFKTELKNAQEE